MVSLSTLYSSLNIDLIKSRNLTLDQKREQILGDAYKIVEYLSHKEPAKIITTDNRLEFFSDYNKTTYIIPQKLSELKGYQYLIISPWANNISKRSGWNFQDSELGTHLNDPKYLNKVYESGEYVVYEVKN